LLLAAVAHDLVATPVAIVRACVQDAGRESREPQSAARNRVVRDLRVAHRNLAMPGRFTHILLRAIASPRSIVAERAGGGGRDISCAVSSTGAGTAIAANACQGDPP
jgi:hypothetical protein